ncbi:MAG: hypothetical protein ACYTGQ_19905, partial [Planctomycetota bacterium]
MNRLSCVVGLALTALAVSSFAGQAMAQASGAPASNDETLDRLLKQRVPSPGVAQPRPTNGPRRVAAPSSSLFVTEQNAIQLPLVKG